MSSLKQLATARKDIFYIEEKRLVIVPGLNIRSEINYGDIAALARSIRSEGIKEALHGYKTEADEFAVTQGHRRRRAIKVALGWIEEEMKQARIDDDKPKIKELKVEIERVANVPVISEEQGKSEIDRLYDQFTLNNGQPLSVLDEAEGFQRLMKAGESESTITRRNGCSKTHFTNCMLLLNEGAAKVLDFVRHGRVSPSLAIELVRKVKDKAEQVKVLEQAVVGLKEGSKVTGKNLDAETRAKIAPSKKGKDKPAPAATPAPAPAAGGRRNITIEKIEEPLTVPMSKKSGVEASITTARLSNGDWVVGVMLRYEGAREFTGTDPMVDGDVFTSRNAAEIEGINVLKDHLLATQRSSSKEFRKKIKFDEAIATVERMLEARTAAGTAAPVISNQSGGSHQSPPIPPPSEVPADQTHDLPEESLVPADTGAPVRHILALRDALKVDKRMKKKLGYSSFVTLNFIADYLDDTAFAGANGGTARGRYTPEEFEKFFTEFIIAGKQ